MTRQPLEAQTLYAELVERLVTFEAERSIGHVPGSFVTKTIGGESYVYFQQSLPGGGRQQLYLGKRSGALDALAERHRQSRETSAPDRASIDRLCSMLRAAGALVTDAPSARVLRALADAGVFQLGGVLVGTHAFTVLGNVLGVHWGGATLRTQDIDLATEARLSIALDGVPSADVPTVLESLEMGFLPVPGLDPARPSTSFKVRGQGLRVDLLTPSRGRASAPRRIARFSAAAEPLRYLDFVMESPVRAAVVDGGGILVNVPEPARFALHKLIVAAERPATFHAKRDKDLHQAAQLLRILAEDRPGDVARAWSALEERGLSWLKRAKSSLRAIETREPGFGELVGLA